MTRPREVGAAVALACLIAAPTAIAQEGWPRCRHDDDCPGFYLNVVTRKGDATVSTARHCGGARRHVWRQRDARETIVQWLDGDAASGSGSLCIPLHPDVSQIRITSMGGHCGHHGDDTVSSASQPGGDVVLSRGQASAVLPGCHARIGTPEVGEVAYGGITLDFSDGYGFGDSYATGHFYGVYDGFGQGHVRPFGASVYAISEFNTYHYRVEILARGRDDWEWSDSGDDREDDDR